MIGSSNFSLFIVLARQQNHDPTSTEDILHISHQANQINAFRAIHAEVSALPDNHRESALYKLDRQLSGILSKKPWDEQLSLIHTDAHNFSEWSKVSLFEGVASKIRHSIPTGQDRDNAMNEVRQAASNLPSADAREAVERALHGLPNYIMVEPNN